MRTLTYWDASPNDGRTKAFTAAGEAFCARQGDVVFNYVAKGPAHYVEDVLAAAEAGAAPDVIDVRPEWVERLRGGGFLLDLATHVADWPAGERYDPAHRKLCAWQDGSYPFLVCDLFVQGTHYRPDLLAEHGMADPRELDQRGEWTLGRLGEMARALHDRGKPLYGLTLRGAEGGELTVFNLMAGAVDGPLFAGGGELLADSQAIDALAAYTALAYDRGCTQPEPQSAGYLQFAWEFYHGKAAFMLHNDDGVKAAQGRFLGADRYATAGLPVEGGSGWMALSGFGVGVWRKSVIAEVAARYALAFVEGYGGRLADSAGALNAGQRAGVPTGPMRPYAATPYPLQQPFLRFIDHPGQLFCLPFNLAGYEGWLRETVRPDIRRLLLGVARPAECARRWAQTFGAMHKAG